VLSLFRLGAELRWFVEHGSPWSCRQRLDLSSEAAIIHLQAITAEGIDLNGFA